MKGGHQDLETGLCNTKDDAFQPTLQPGWGSSSTSSKNVKVVCKTKCPFGMLLCGVIS